MQNIAERTIASMRRSQVARVVLVGSLVLLLKIPIAMITELLTERQTRHLDAVQEVTSKWGKLQVITGPVLTVPYKHRWTEVGKRDQKVVHTEVRHATFLPDRLHARGEMAGEVRYRGIFSVPVYRLRADVEGEFSRPDFSGWGIDPTDVMWDRAQVSVGISDPRAIQEQTRLTWNREQIAFLPGVGDFPSVSSAGIHAPLTGHLRAKSFTFSFPLALNGSVGAYLVPVGRDTALILTSNWSTPSFQGGWLPAHRTVSARGFEAAWNIPFLGRDFPQAWMSVTDLRKTIESSRVGVDLVVPVDEYRLASRSIKYAGLFTFLTFASIWLVEVLAKLRVHPIQYLLLGAALSLFYLLELSLSEHIGFGMAYLLASFSVVGMVIAYSKVIFKTTRRATIIGLVVAALYGYLYILLNNEDYALLVGSVGLFVILGLIMFLTRRVNWFSTQLPEESPFIPAMGDSAAGSGALSSNV